MDNKIQNNNGPFICYCPECDKIIIFKSVNKFKTHFRKKHPNLNEGKIKQI